MDLVIASPPLRYKLPGTLFIIGSPPRLGKSKIL